MHNFNLIGGKSYNIMQLLTNNNQILIYIFVDHLKLISYNALYGILNSKVTYLILMLISLL